MVPFILNDIPGKLIQISMEGSVGQFGKNLSPDVRLVQSMLNNVPFGDGGPSPALVVDGLIGPKSIAAIVRFQQASRLRVVDGRIDPLGATITALGRLLNSRDMLPSNMAGIGRPDQRIIKGLTGGPVPVTGSGAFPGQGPGFDSLGLTDWKFVSSAGIGIGVFILGAGAMKFFFESNRRPGFTRIFPWIGIGAGLSAMPVGLDFSAASMPSFGTNIHQGLVLGSNPMPEDDFLGFCSVISIGASVGVGLSGTFCFFGSPVPSILIARALGAIAGMEAGLPGASITGFFGSIGSPLN